MHFVQMLFCKNHDMGPDFQQSEKVLPVIFAAKRKSLLSKNIIGYCG